MNNRVLELLFQPHSIQENDLPLIEKELIQYPFVQSIRALYLLGVSNFQQDKYTETLAKTAAFTTDKKILYVLINGKNIDKVQEINSIQTENTEPPKTDENSVAQCNINDANPCIENPIVEENTLKIKELDLIDSETTEAPIVPIIEEKSLEIDIFVEEKRVETSDEKEEISTEINFYEHTESSFTHTPIVQKENFTPNFQSVDKYEEERRKLIEEVERKLKEKRQKPPQENVEEEVFSGNEINFSEAEMALEREEKNTLKQDVSDWKPMNLETESSAFRNRTTELSNTIYHQTEKKELDNYSIENQQEKETDYVEIPSSNLATENSAVEQNEEKSTEDSNVPSFLSTWQSWLKIDRNSSVKTFASPKKTKVQDIKAQAIDKFIATEPKISPIKKEEPQPITTKERKDDDISHLMTETLANIYVEQRLYNRAIDAYEILCEKNPTKKEEFLLKIEEIKQLKSANSGQWS